MIINQLKHFVIILLVERNYERNTSSLHIQTKYTERKRILELVVLFIGKKRISFVIRMIKQSKLTIVQSRNVVDMFSLLIDSVDEITLMNDDENV